MFRFSKIAVLLLALVAGFVGFEATLEGKTAGSGFCPPSVLEPTIEALLDEPTQSLKVTGQGTPQSSFIFRLYYSISGGSWQYLSPIPGVFDANGQMSFSVPLNVFQGYGRVEAIMDITAIDTSSGSVQWLTSMAWGMLMRRFTPETLRNSDDFSFWETWYEPLPETSAPTFPMTMGTIASGNNPNSRVAEILIFHAGPALSLQQYYSTGIEGMLPVN